MTELRQTPDTAAALILYCGDTLDFVLDAPREGAGTAWLRTNIMDGATRLQEIVQHIEQAAPILSRDWHDIPMEPAGGGRYRITIPLLEPGRYEAKAFFLPAGSGEPRWPAGGNTIVKVEPAATCSVNNIYTAFVRQFGRNSLPRPPDGEQAAATARLEQDGYAVIPRSGTFRDLVRELEFIVGTLRFRTIQLLPIFPTPTTYARLGRFGSPFAGLDFMDVDPALAEFDRQTTPLMQFCELVDAVHAREARLFLDVPVNHTGWGSWLQIHHPEWFVRNADATFRSPGAWGVVWEDLAQLDYRFRELWTYIADVFLFWCRQGVDGFRCDAGYMIPRPAWEYIVARVRREFPDTVFLLEGLGGRAEVVEDLLDRANLDWAYSEIFQQYDRRQFEEFFPECRRLSRSRGRMVHYAETHDNSRLAARSPDYARLRCALAALLADDGAFGIANGVEWFATEKIDVHEAPSLNWGHAPNQVAWIARLNAILEAHPAFHGGAESRLIQQGPGNVLAVLRTAPAGAEPCLVLANLGDEPADVQWAAADHEPGATGLHDLLSERAVAPLHRGGLRACRLAGGEILGLVADRAWVERVAQLAATPVCEPARNHTQRLRALALRLRCFVTGRTACADVDAAELAASLAGDPAGFCARLAGTGRPPLTRWRWPADARRRILWPPGDVLLVTAPHPFHASLERAGARLGRAVSLRAADGSHFAFILPPSRGQRPAADELRWTVFDPAGPHSGAAPLLLLSPWPRTMPPLRLSAAEVRARDISGLCTNGRGGMVQARGAWGELRSQYDALLAANLHPAVPVDRRILLTRCRAWLVHRGYSQELNRDNLVDFSRAGDGSLSWNFDVPTGMGQSAQLGIRVAMPAGRNAVRVEFTRAAGRDADHLPDDREVRLIVRPDVEDRNFHDKTKAYMGAERDWPQALYVHADGFSFAPSGLHRLDVRVEGGLFTREPEWQYMVGHPLDAGRGLDGSSDLFSPGYFTLTLRGDERRTLEARVHGAGEPADAPDPEEPRAAEHAVLKPRDLLRQAMADFIVRRDRSRTVIAGYPWFLDWGRDTLICLRGILAAGHVAETRDILLQFARFEADGTLPNMIRGDDQSNRDTSDAPLWFFVACADTMAALGGETLLQEDCGGRPLREVLLSIGRGYSRGTPNGMRLDPESGLVFSPAHFTWMDTNHPAASPREGYPIEIQSLWVFALRCLARLEPAGPWAEHAQRAARSIHELFVLPDGYLSDCLHAAAGQPARAAEADDALRPNQLFAITLGVIDDRKLGASILNACEELLVPGGIRSLADRPVRRALPVYRHGALLNQPHRPYIGRYEGDEDTRRKPAYHNGTAWTWPFPSYCEALWRVHGAGARATALAVLSSGLGLLYEGNLGQIPEIMDGDAPHEERGCLAQAWGVTELYRVMHVLQGAPPAR